MARGLAGDAEDSFPFLGIYAVGLDTGGVLTLVSVTGVIVGVAAGVGAAAGSAFTGVSAAVGEFSMYREVSPTRR